jgi:putative ABC transport system permease protein
VVSPDYFQTMRIPILAGRAFSDSDTLTSDAVVIVNQELARRFWRGQDPIGKRVRVGGNAKYYRVVGVARDGRYRTLAEERFPYLYFDLQQSLDSNLILLARTTGDPRIILPLIGRVSRQIDPGVPITDLQTLRDTLSGSLLLPRLAASFFGAFGLLGITLASIGLYGVVSFNVSQRSREVGIRLALGAKPVNISFIVVRRALKPVFIGITLGLGVAFALSRSLSAILYGVGQAEALTFVGSAFFLFLVALGACWIPVRRTVQSDAMTQLRHE